MTLEEFVRELEADGYDGADIDIEVSLCEYGIAWKQSDDGESIDFIVGSSYDTETNMFNEWYEASMDRNDWPLDWMKLDKAAISMGLEADSLKEFDPVSVYHAAIYYGWESICPRPICASDYIKVDDGHNQADRETE